jgi:hypothetical protein
MNDNIPYYTKTPYHASNFFQNSNPYVRGKINRYNTPIEKQPVYVYFLKVFFKPLLLAPLCL